MNRCNAGCQEQEKKREEWVKSVPTQSSAFKIQRWQTLIS